ncbi:MULTISPECIES: acyl-CoA desaturase [Cyanophyceae]|uniref:acyl-CoA desaturase n=1 Tax=Cyanophyceae TaxID=3028117 RepID=UPI00000B420B|nr:MULTISPECIES: acyl-CoA desaturase [Cyanophyceae]AAF21447.1 fatty acid desaturase [Picosynechococcus sp. PCC 7002]ACB00802.1 fatty acid desaturase [Picosynechococcus sp. PCC 7002]SMH47139.1 stearoyl-CoA desaturase (delta-9 desaturase) [Picosynechococcus sp. OG1]SMQ80959.1 stearoyl-CoA desaturase (delta-9 desaturase) [Synechococcus sp. 7002]
MTHYSNVLDPIPSTPPQPNPRPRNYSRLTRLSYATGPVWIILCHLGMAIAFFTGLSWGAVLWIVFWYWLRMLGTTAIYHRLLTHKAYQASPWVKWIGSFITASAGQMGPSWWKAHHEDHHRFSDHPGDPHSSKEGFWWAHYRWLISPNTFPKKLPADIERDPILKLIDRFHFVPLIALGALSYGVGGLEYLAAFFISTTLLFHGVAFVNSVCHKWGDRPFQTTDHSRNNSWVAVLALGEGWHNLHHAFGWSVRHGITIQKGKVKYLPDFTYSFIRLLERMGLASKLKQPTVTDLQNAANP